MEAKKEVYQSVVRTYSQLSRNGFIQIMTFLSVRWYLMDVMRSLS